MCTKKLHFRENLKFFTSEQSGIKVGCLKTVVTALVYSDGLKMCPNIVHSNKIKTKPPVHNLNLESCLRNT